MHMRNHKDFTPLDLGDRVRKKCHFLELKQVKEPLIEETAYQRNSLILRRWFVSCLLMRKSRFPNVYLGNPVTNQSKAPKRCAQKNIIDI